MACWGIAYVPSAWLVQEMPFLLAAALRLGVAGVLLLVVAVAVGRSLHPGVGWTVVVWIGFTQTSLFYGATFWGVEREGAGLAAVLANTDPLFVAVLSAWFLGEVLRRRQWIGLVLGFVGAAVTVSHRQLWPPDPSIDSLIVVGGAVAWSVGTVVAARQIRAIADPLTLAGWQMTIGGVLLAGAAALDPGPVGFGPAELGLVLGLAIIGSALPLALFYRALALAPAGTVSAWFFLVPVLGVVSAWPLLGEVPGVAVAIGLPLVSMGLWLVLGDSDEPGVASIDRQSMPVTRPDPTRT